MKKCMLSGISIKYVNKNKKNNKLVFSYYSSVLHCLFLHTKSITNQPYILTSLIATAKQN